MLLLLPGEGAVKKETLRIIEEMQNNEAAEHVVYNDLARRTAEPNSGILARIAAEELKHAGLWRKYTGRMPSCHPLKRLYYRLLAFIFGVTFVINLMERNEHKAQEIYRRLAPEVSESLMIYEQEQEHEKNADRHDR